MKKLNLLEEKLLLAFDSKDEAKMKALVTELETVSENKKAYLEYVLDHITNNIPPEKISHIVNYIAPDLLEEKIRINYGALIRSGQIIFLRKYHELWIQLLELKIRSYGKPESAIPPQSLFLYSLVMLGDISASIHGAIQDSPNRHYHYLFLKLISTYWISQKRNPLISGEFTEHLPSVIVDIVLSYCGALDQAKTLEKIMEAIEKELAAPESKASGHSLFRSPSNSSPRQLFKSDSDTLLAPNSKNVSPLIVAASTGASEMIELLLNKKADPTVHFGGNCALIWAVEGRHREAAEILLKSIEPPTIKL